MYSAVIFNSKLDYFNTKGQIGYARKTKRHEIFFFQLLNIILELFWFTFHLWTIYFVKNYPLSTTQGDCFVSCENVVSQFVWGTIPAKIHGLNFQFIIWTSNLGTWILQLNSKFFTLPLDFAFNLNSSNWPRSLCIFNSLHQIT